ncbi:MAG: type I restriction enzyme S subunit [Pseudoalteromonas tetraodonis]|uniref:restriction endonuclease subunit S n=1 Tax=Pseudoalteromonas tetraodonis TaxID=43659 RepID=UPI003988A2F9
MSWPLVKLSDVVQINPRCPKEIDGDQLVSFVAMASASEDGKLLSEEIKVLNETKKGFTYFERGDVLLAKITPCFENGKCLRPNQISKTVGFGSTEFHVLRANREKLDSSYLFYMIWSKAFRFMGEHSMSGAAGQKRVSVDFLKAYEIPLPPLEEQKRIAAILDKADSVRRKRQQAIDLADDFLRSVFLDMFGDPVSNPKDFEKVCLGHVCKIKGGKRIPKGEKLVKENTGYPYIKAGNIKNGRVNTNKLEYVPHHVREKIARYTVEAGDVCLTVVGANIGDVGVVPNELNNASLTENANKLLIQNKNIITNFYLASALQMDFIQNQIKSKTMAVGVPKLALFRIEQLEILIPPMELQIRFESIVNKVDGYLDRMATSGSFCDKQFNSLSQKAFAGEL